MSCERLVSWFGVGALVVAGSTACSDDERSREERDHSSASVVAGDEPNPEEGDSEAEAEADSNGGYAPCFGVAASSQSLLPANIGFGNVCETLHGRCRVPAQPITSLCFCGSVCGFIEP